MAGSKSRRRDVPLKLAAVVIAMIAVSFLAGERVGVALASRGNQALPGRVATAASPASGQGQENAPPALASEGTDAPGVGADCNTDYR